MYNGKTIYLHDQGEFISDAICNSNFYFEEDTLRMIAGKYDVSSVIDIGANIGNHAHFFSANCGSRVYCFEPSSENFNLLKLNCPDQVIFKLALGENIGTTSLITYESCKGNNTLGDLWEQAPDWGTGAKTEEVVVARLDDFSFPEVTFIKIDVEGSELRVLKGAIETINMHKPVISVEMHTDETLYAGKFQYQRNDIIKLMNSLGYCVNHTDAYGNHFFTPEVMTSQSDSSATITF
jgi:FkbM family methyltransferase